VFKNVREDLVELMKTNVYDAQRELYHVFNLKEA